MSEYVWMCTAQRDSQLVRGFWAELDDGQPQKSTLAERTEVFQLNEMGIPLAKDRFPEKVFWRRKSKFNKSLPNVFHSGYIFINKKASDVLGEFDLGQGALHPVALFQNDRKSQIEADISTLCIGNQKDTVLLDQAKRMNRIWPGQDFFAPHLVPVDDEIVVQRSCLEGPDIWADPKVKRVFFMSDRLMKGLKKARIQNAFRPIRCLVF